MAVQPAPFNTMTTYSAATRQLARIQMDVQLQGCGTRGGTASSEAETALLSPHQRIEGYDSIEAAVADSAPLASE